MSDDVAEKNTPAPQEVGGKQSEVTYSFSDGLAQLLAKLNVSLLFSSYQSGLVYQLGRRRDGGLHLHQTAVMKPMGICVPNKQELILSSGHHIGRYHNMLAPHEQINEQFDACYVPRTLHCTGNLDMHDVGLDRNGRIVFVNTRFNCLATPHDQHSFEMIWKPDFITELADEDRCHLNGLAMDKGEAAYVTAVSKSNTIDGWRDRRDRGGVVIDVVRNEVLCEGLSMPHSPRLHQDKLWVMNSGTGELGTINRKAGTLNKFEPFVFCPGFLRGLAFVGNYAFVGLSKPRYKRFEGLALDERLQKADSEPWCGIQVIDLNKGTCVEWLRIDGAVSELYDVAVLPHFARPMIVTLDTPEAANLITFAKP